MFFIFLIIVSFSFSYNPIDYYIYGNNIHTVIGGFQNGIDKPRDLDFNPLYDNELWVLNEGESPLTNNAEHIESVCVPENSEIRFTIYDSYSDGICCESGDGFYEVIGCENQFAYGGDFESFESTIFTVDVSCNSICPNGSVELQIIVNTDNWGKETSWTLIDNISDHIYANRLAPGGSTVTFFDAGSEFQTSEYRKDSYSRHFMNTASALSFDEFGFFANTLECKDANNNVNGLFSGPTLWNSDFSVYANVNQDGPLLGSHLDMIHQSPYSMGIEHAGQGNIYWVFDAYHSALVRYDFATPHEYGGHDHSDGKVWRYGDINLEREPGVSSHMVLNHDSDSNKKQDSLIQSRNDNLIFEALDSEEASQVAGIEITTPAMLYRDAGYILPKQICEELIEHPKINLQLSTTVKEVIESRDEVSLIINNKTKKYDFVCLCAGSDTEKIYKLEGFSKKRGQVTHIHSRHIFSDINLPICGKGYISPEINNIHVVGSSYSDIDTLDVLEEEHQHNLENLKIINNAQAEIKAGKVGFRAVSKDHMPVVGNQARVFVNTCHGSRASVTAPICADIVSSLISGKAPPLEKRELESLSPNRFN